MRSIWSGVERVEREARRHALAVEQDLRVAVAEAAHADRAAASGPALDRHAGQALEHVAEGRVAEAVDLVAADDDLGGGRVAPLLDVVRARLPVICTGARAARPSVPAGGAGVGAGVGRGAGAGGAVPAWRGAAPAARAGRARRRPTRADAQRARTARRARAAGARADRRSATQCDGTLPSPASLIDRAATARESAHPAACRASDARPASPTDGALELGLGHRRAALDAAFAASAYSWA